VAYDALKARALFGSGQLPINWAMSPPDLAALMNQCQERWASGEGSTRTPTVSSDIPRPREPTVT
jgi:hypothetical protein